MVLPINQGGKEGYKISNHDLVFGHYRYYVSGLQNYMYMYGLITNHEYFIGIIVSD